MNCPSRVDALFDEGYNQNPNALNADATTRADMNHMANARLRCDHCIDTTDGTTSDIKTNEHIAVEGEGNTRTLEPKAFNDQKNALISEEKALPSGSASGSQSNGSGRVDTIHNYRLVACGFSQKALAVLRKYAKFIGPGFMVAVAYIDPGMLSTLSSCSRVSQGSTKLPYVTTVNFLLGRGRRPLYHVPDLSPASYTR
jgi:metal iron transporter